MIAFGCAVTRPDIYRACAARGFQRVAEPDSVVLDGPAAGTIFQSYNALIDRARELDGIEALVLVHQDAEIVDADFCAKVRTALAEPDVGVVGCVGSVGVRSIAWWEGSIAQASFMHRYAEHGGGDLPAFSWAWEEAPPYARIGDVDTLDGFVLALSPWAVRELRFDESLGSLHGYDLDLCCQVREAGRRVVTAGFRAIHNHALEPFSDPQEWIAAHMVLADKWDGRIPGMGWAPGTWRERALRAEAEADAAKLASHSLVLEHEARERELERALEETRTSISWRLGAPLRALERRRAATG